MKCLIQRFRDDETGASAIEYGLIAAGIAIAIIATVNLFGAQLAANFEAASSAFDRREVHRIGSVTEEGK